MKDKFIKRILSSDSSTPQAKANEWSNILIGIESTKSSRVSDFFRVNPMPIFASLIIILCFILAPLTTTKKLEISLAEKNELIDYLIDDIYDQDLQERYSWVNLD